MWGQLSSTMRSQLFSAVQLDEISLREDERLSYVARSNAARRRMSIPVHRGRARPLLRWVPRLERNRSPIPRGGHRTCCGTEDGALLASVSTIVVVAGQTRVHAINLDGQRA